jgi:hypothetical protein
MLHGALHAAACSQEWVDETAAEGGQQIGNRVQTQEQSESIGFAPNPSSLSAVGDPVNAAQTIRRLGFRKWYERELMQSHANLVLLLLAMVGLFASAELFSSQLAPIDRLQVLGGGGVSAAIGYFALGRFLRLLSHAEYVADQAICRGCDTYAKWELIGEEANGLRLQVRCKKCSHRWPIEL